MPRVIQSCCALLACAAACLGQVSTNAVASPGARHTFDSIGRAPDGRLQYLFTTGDPVVTNRVFMGGSIGGRQLLGYTPNTRSLTLSGPGGREMVLAKGASFTQSLPKPRPQEPAQDAGASATTTAPCLPYTTAPVLVYSGASGATAGGAVKAAATRGVGKTVITRSGGSNVVTLQPNEYFFGTQYMYPTRFEVKTFTFPTANNGTVTSFPVVVPGDFRVGGYGIQGSQR